MLKVVDDGVVIQLSGVETNPMLIPSAILVVLAVVLVVIAMTMSVKITIGAMAVFAILIFIFNRYRQRYQYEKTIATGQLVIKNRHFISAGYSIKLSDDAIIIMHHCTLTIKDLGRVWRIMGFDSEKECLVAQSVLEGRVLQKCEQAIRIM